MNFKIFHRWGKKGKEERYVRILSKEEFNILYGPLFQEFSKLAMVGDCLEVRIGNLHYLVNTEEG